MPSRLPMSPEERLDQWIFHKGFVKSRSQARDLIARGGVCVDNRPCWKPSKMVSHAHKVKISQKDCAYISRGGLKLETALSDFTISVRNKVVLDVGASTGGFTACVLEKGAKHVYCVDVGTGQLDGTLRIDNRVSFWEGISIQEFSMASITDVINIILVDVSFVSLHKIIPHLTKFLPSGGELLALIKPQFEVGRRGLNKSGVVKGQHLIEGVLSSTKELMESHSFTVLGMKPSEIKGKKGNQEFFLYGYKK